MSKPATFNWQGVAGNTLAFEVRMPFDCTGDVWVLRAVTLGGQQVFRKTTAVGGGMTLTDISGATPKWRIACTLSAAETRQMATGCVYDLERRAGVGGEQRTYLVGNFVMSGGANDDV